MNKKVTTAKVATILACLVLLALTPSVVSNNAVGHSPGQAAVTRTGIALPANSSAIALSLANRTLSFPKEAGWNLTVEADVTNPIGVYGTVVDPAGQIHSMLVEKFASGLFRLAYTALSSDPAGDYKVTVFVRASGASSPLQIYTVTKTTPGPSLPVDRP